MQINSDQNDIGFSIINMDSTGILLRSPVAPNRSVQLLNYSAIQGHYDPLVKILGGYCF